MQYCPRQLCRWDSRPTSATEVAEMVYSTRTLKFNYSNTEYLYKWPSLLEAFSAFPRQNLVSVLSLKMGLWGCILPKAAAKSSNVSNRIPRKGPVLCCHVNSVSFYDTYRSFTLISCALFFLLISSCKFSLYFNSPSSLTSKYNLKIIE